MRSTKSLINIIINDRHYNSKYDIYLSKKGIKHYRKLLPIIKYPIEFMRINSSSKTITFMIYKSTIKTIFKTIRMFSIIDFQYDITVMENCSSVMLNQLRPFNCLIATKKPLANGVKIITMLLDDKSTNADKVKPIVRLLGDNTRKYDYYHLLFVPRFYSIEEIKNVKYANYVAIVNFENTYLLEEQELCIFMFPKLMFIDGDNTIEKISFAYKEMMKMYNSTDWSFAKHRQRFIR